MSCSCHPLVGQCQRYDALTIDQPRAYRIALNELQGKTETDL